MDLESNHTVPLGPNTKLKTVMITNLKATNRGSTILTAKAKKKKTGAVH